MSEKKRNAIGVDIGGTNYRVARIDEDGTILEKVKGKTSLDDPLAEVREGIKKLRDENTAGVGVAMAGLLDRENLKVITSPNIPALKNRSVADLAGDLPLTIENDGNAAALGESLAGAGRGIDNFVLLTLGTGIGGGFVRNGRLLRVPAEVGHVTVESSGLACPCGNHGCLEQYAAARGLVEHATALIEDGSRTALRDCCDGNFYRLTAEDIYRAALDGDTLAREALKSAGRYLGIGMAAFINLLAPQAIILSGGLTGAWGIYVASAEKEARRRAFKKLAENVKVLKAELEDTAGVVGAAALVFDRA